MDPIAIRIIKLAKASIRTRRQRVLPVRKAHLIRHAPEEIYVLLRDEEIHSVYRIATRRCGVVVQNGHRRGRRSAQAYAYRVTQRHIECFSSFDQSIIDYGNVEALRARLSGGPTERSQAGSIVAPFTRLAGHLRTGSVQA